MSLNSGAWTQVVLLGNNAQTNIRNILKSMDSDMSPPNKDIIRTYEGPWPIAGRPSTPASEDATVAEAVGKLFKMTKVPDNWTKLVRYTRVNGEAITSFDTSATVAAARTWDLGHQLERTDEGVQWTMWDVLDGAHVQHGLFVFNKDMRLRLSSLNMFYYGYWDTDESDTCSIKARIARVLESVQPAEQFWDECTTE